MICDNRRPLYLSRIKKFMNRLARGVLSETVPLEATFAHCVQPVYFDDRLALTYEPIGEGATWGATWESAWFYLEGAVPVAWAGKKVVAQLDFNGEGLIFDETGVPLQGLTNGSVFATGAARDLFPLFDAAEGGEAVSLWVEAAANGLFGVRKEQDPPRNCPTRHGNYSGTVNKIRLAVFETEMYQLWLDIFVLFDLYHALPETSTRAVRILSGLSNMVDFFERIARHADAMPTWSGELYLELHRGTLTTQSRTKRGNRLLEQALRETEYLLSCGALEAYPREELDALWKALLLNQFHDILPGSSIHMVYEQTEQEYAAALAACERIQKEAAGRLFEADADKLVLVNTLNLPFTRPVVLPEGWAAAEGVVTQRETDGTVAAQVEIPAQGSPHVHLQPAAPRRRIDRLRRDGRSRPAQPGAGALCRAQAGRRSRAGGGHRRGRGPRGAQEGGEGGVPCPSTGGAARLRGHGGGDAGGPRRQACRNRSSGVARAAIPRRPRREDPHEAL